jgi:hypothetical protein
MRLELSSGLRHYRFMRQTARAAKLLVPETLQPAVMPDFLSRLRANYGDKVLAVSGADLLAEDRKRYWGHTWIRVSSSLSTALMQTRPPLQN